MRLGMPGGNKRLPQNKLAAYGLMTVGALIMLLSMPFFVYAAIAGGLILYWGYTMRGR